MFQKVSEWLTEKSDRVVRGRQVDRTNSYYATDAADRAYGARQNDAEDAEGDAERQPLDPFGRDANDEYGGRVPYRSQRDAQMEAEQQRQMEETVRRQAARPQAQPAYAAYQAQQAGFATPPQQAGYTAAQQPQAQPRAGYANQPQQNGYANQQGFAANPQQPNNVVNFPGMVQGQNGNVYAHVEYVVLLCNRSECTKVIEYIKTTASVFLNMEFIANDSERQRCVDMLSGAAYTLGCQLTKISARGIYLISSPAVQVVIDPKLRKYTSAPEAQGFARQSYDAGAYGGYAAQPNDGYAYAEAAQPMTHRQPRQQQPAAQPARQPMQAAQPAQRQTFTASSPTSSFAAQPRRAANGMQGMFAANGAYDGYADAQADRFTAEYKS